MPQGTVQFTVFFIFSRELIVTRAERRIQQLSSHATFEIEEKVPHDQCVEEAA